MQVPVFVNYDQTLNKININTAKGSYDGMTFKVSYRGKMPVSYRTNCVFYYDVFTVLMVSLKIIPSAAASVSYNIWDPVKTVT